MDLPALRTASRTLTVDIIDREVLRHALNQWLIHLRENPEALGKDDLGEAMRIAHTRITDQLLARIG